MTKYLIETRNLPFFSKGGLSDELHVLPVVIWVMGGFSHFFRMKLCNWKKLQLKIYRNIYIRKPPISPTERGLNHATIE